MKCMMWLMRSQVFLLVLLFSIIISVDSNSEGDALHAWNEVLEDENNALITWDPTQNPCDHWQYITCNPDNNVVRVDLVNQRLFGPLVPQLGALINLQFLQLENNSIYGSIPMEIGNLTSLISLDLQHNLLNGSIPSTLGNLKFLRILRLNDNQLTGKVPLEITQLASSGSLGVMNVSNNLLELEESSVEPTPTTGKSSGTSLNYVWAVGFGTLLVVFIL